MTDRPPLKNVAVFGHVGKGNLGDEATVAAVIQNVRLRHPDAEICAFTLEPADTETRHQIPAFPIRRLRKSSLPVSERVAGTAGAGWSTPVGAASRIRQGLKKLPVLGGLLRRLRNGALAIPAGLAGLAFLLESNRRLKGTDLFIVAGGGQLGDYFGGAWGYPFTILQWSLLAKARGAKLVFLSVGAGPIDTFLGKRFIRWALAPADYRSFRDEGSRKLIEDLGVSGENHVFPDLVHGLQPQSGGNAGTVAGVVGINPLPFHDTRYWAEDSPDVYHRYVQKLASFAAWLIKSGQKVVLFPTQVRADPPVIRDVEALVRDSLPVPCGDALTCPAVSSFDDLLAVIAQTDLVVASRFHGIVLSLLMGKPVIGLSYNQKTDELMTGMGLGEFVADIDRFEVPWLIARLERLRADAEAIRARIESRSEEYRTALESQYGLVLGETVRPEPHMALQTA